MLIGYLFVINADVAQLVERKLPKLEVAGSRPVIRSISCEGCKMDIARFLDEAYLSPIPHVQIFFGRFFLLPLYFVKKLKITVEGIENIPNEPVIFAMNHTDRYNYWPFQFYIWRNRKKYGIKHPYTATWVKGKYYENRWVAKFMKLTGNIPVPSKGYLIAKDFVDFFGKEDKLNADDFKILKSYVDGNKEEDDLKNCKDERVFKLISTAHDEFDPSHITYREYINSLFFKLMGKVKELNEDAVKNKGVNLIIFPEGTRSKKLIKGKPGIAQVALSLKIPVVPIGCNGSDKAYSGNLPFPEKNKEIVYRVGKPILLYEDFKIEENFIPFTPQSAKLNDIFEKATEVIMEKISELLDKEYQGDYTKKDSMSISSFI